MKTKRSITSTDGGNDPKEKSLRMKIGTVRKFYRWIKCSKPEINSELSYNKALDFVLRDLDSSIEFNKKIRLISGLSFLLWLIVVLIYAISKKSLEIFFDKETYPAAIWAVITGAFSQLEIDEKKKRLYELFEKSLKQRKDTVQNEVTEHPNTITQDKLRETIWEEYKNRFQ